MYLPTRQVCALSFASSSWCRNRNCPGRSSLGTAACAVGAPASPSHNTWPAPHGSESATAQPHIYIHRLSQLHDLILTTPHIELPSNFQDMLLFRSHRSR